MSSQVSPFDGERRRRTECNFWHLVVPYVDDSLLL